MKKVKKQGLVGAAVMAGLILLSMPLGVGKSLSRLREEAAGQFYYDLAEYSIYDGLEKRREAAENLLTIAERYADSSPQLEAAMDEVEYQIRVCENSYDETFIQTVEANGQLGQAAAGLAGALEAAGLSEQDQKYPAQLLAQLESEQDKIARSSYNDAAREFNARLQRFPANILAPIAGVGPLGLF